MKKSMLICAVGLCTMIIGGTVIASEFVPKEEVTINEEDVKMSEKTMSHFIQVDNLRPLEVVVEELAEPEETENVTSAETPQEADTQSYSSIQSGCYFTDENHDGFCDYGDIHYHNDAHMDSNCDGFCDYGDHYCMQGSDTNGDGICDNYHAMHDAHHSYVNNSGNTSGNALGNTSGNTSYGSHHLNKHGGGHHR